MIGQSRVSPATRSHRANYHFQPRAIMGLDKNLPLPKLPVRCGRTLREVR